MWIHIPPGRIIFIAMIEDGFFYSINTTSTDPKNLKYINHLTNESMNMRGDSIYERIEKKINDGSYERAEIKRPEMQIEKDTMKVNPNENVDDESVNIDLDNVRANLVTVVGLVTILGLVLVLLVRRKK